MDATPLLAAHQEGDALHLEPASAEDAHRGSLPPLQDEPQKQHRCRERDRHSYWPGFQGTLTAESTLPTSSRTATAIRCSPSRSVSCIL